MKLSDRRIIEFLWKSPIKTFDGILDTLRYLEGNWMPEDIEYELFNDALGDNLNKKVRIRVPNIKGMTATSLMNLTWHLFKFHLAKRRVRKAIDRTDESIELIVFYELTPAGKEVLKLLEAIERAKEKLSP